VRGTGTGKERISSTIILLDTTLDTLCTLLLIRSDPAVVATRQTSSSGRPKSPRIQVVLPEDLCERLAALAEEDSRTISNMAKVLIQQGVEARERQRSRERSSARPSEPQRQPERHTERFREELERQEQAKPSRLRGAPRRLRLQRPRDT
jgi:CopG-like RHH_1 or ribbon-helix-helix domain, RHH_5